MRWIGILPLSAIGYLLPAWSSYWTLNTFINVNEGWGRLILSTLSTVLGCRAFVVIGSICCPERYRSYTTIILTVILITVIGVLSGIVFTHKSYQPIRAVYATSFIAGYLVAIITCLEYAPKYWRYERYGQIDRDLDSFKIQE